MKKLLLVASTLLACTSLSAKEQGRYDDGARWAFVTDQKTTNVAVIDTFNFNYVDEVALKTTPIRLEVSDVQDLLVYVDGKTPQIYVYDLVKKTHWVTKVKSVPNEISFHPDGAQLAVAMKDRIEIIKPLKRELVTAIDGIKSPFSMNFDNGGYNLYVSESDSGKTLIYRNHDGKKSHIAIGKGAVSELTLSPDARLALVSQYKDNSVIVWDLMMNMRMSSYQFESAPWRPYVSSDSEYIVLASEDGSAQVIESWGGKVVKEFKLSGTPQSIRTGWIEQMGIIESPKALDIFELTSDKPATSVPLKSELGEVVIVSDSKTLFATQKDSSKLFVYDIRSKKILNEIDTKLAAPNLLSMGITNTICH
ncbi:WD40 repeat domain-containing protein [Vibrio vulnificus]|uniref:WD40 repeat domain-containing protein n=1 Tax=Vibrio vulnificus TaxID=672 RepID=UPI0010239122|nr:WD40 repeat domain-containing protein [Vibrio vulnificus]EGR0753418.1 WD40 repeat domain-containing protein [Vibrio vulnificus]ELM0339448.1 WD40 repeat domain-containing protein [Vibrio vulnificus]RZP94887.1 WD40 repeat domain-containing protein [Vibrio vulnificus]RZQ20043.1 WD40 repeat domain-containing protein [Vibrio vulnificus]RZQ25252.1 WD40 repeat domain-containing protein [Vibrio vulnificus]